MMIPEYMCKISSADKNIMPLSLSRRNGTDKTWNISSLSNRFQHGGCILLHFYVPYIMMKNVSLKRSVNKSNLKTIRSRTRVNSYLTNLYQHVATRHSGKRVSKQLE